MVILKSEKGGAHIPLRPSEKGGTSLHPSEKGETHLPLHSSEKSGQESGTNLPPRPSSSDCKAH